MTGGVSKSPHTFKRQWDVNPARSICNFSKLLYCCGQKDARRSWRTFCWVANQKLQVFGQVIIWNLKLAPIVLTCHSIYPPGVHFANYNNPTSIEICNFFIFRFCTLLHTFLVRSFWWQLESSDCQTAPPSPPQWIFMERTRSCSACRKWRITRVTCINIYPQQKQTDDAV